ncbi:MAG: RDD family protein [Ruminococcaceae bacterium]|nr:RDD family protein [Oscillospiraceae bacterium]
MLRKRLLAYIVDIFIVFIPMIIYTILLDINPRFFNFEVFMFLSYVPFGLIIFKDIIGNQSIGKRIFKLKVVTLQGQKPNVFQFIVRNILALIWPLEAFMLVILDKPRIGDLIARTKVVADNEDKDKGTV